jgi:hypothetical protein
MYAYVYFSPSITFEGVTSHDITGKNEFNFWIAFSRGLKAAAKVVGVQVSDITCQGEFLDVFLKTAWETEVVILLDEFSELYDYSDDVRNEFLRAIRALKDHSQYAVRCVISAGTFSILDLNTTKSTVSPFNASDSLQNPYFTLQETMALFHQFAEDRDLLIDDEVIQDIWAKSGGLVINLHLVYHSCSFVLTVIRAWSAFADVAS